MAENDYFHGYSEHLDSPGNYAFAVTPSNSDLPSVVRSLFVGNGGSVKVDMAGSGTVTFENVQDGAILPVRVSKVYASGTSASGIVGIY